MADGDDAVSSTYSLLGGARAAIAPGGSGGQDGQSAEGETRGTNATVKVELQNQQLWARNPKACTSLALRVNSLMRLIGSF